MELTNTNSIANICDELCEESVLGTLLSYPTRINDSRDILTEECFFNNKNKAIYNAIIELDSKGESVSIITVIPILQGNNSGVAPSYVAETSSKTILSDEYYQYAMRLYELTEKRKIYQIGYYLMQSSSNETEDVNEILSNTRKELDGFTNKKADQYISFNNSLEKVSSIVTSNLSNENSVIGTKTGFRKIDDKGGWQPSDLIVIAAETSQGKTALASSITLNVISNGGKVAFYSMEMQHQQVSARLLAMKSKVSSSSILYGKLNKEELDRFDKAIGELWDKNLFFDDRDSSNIDVILASIRNMKAKYDIDGAVVDYLQILSVNRGNRSSTDEQLMGDVARRLKNLAKELGIWIMALSQLSRNQDSPVPTMQRLRSSGQIAEAADVVVLVYRPECYDKKYPEPYTNMDTHGTALINITKGRNIGLSKFICKFDAPCTYFYDDDSIGQYTPNNNDDSPF